MESATDILALKEKDARVLFPGDLPQVKAAYRKLAAAWHPDRCGHPSAAEVFARLTVLRGAAERMAGASRPAIARSREYVSPSGRKFRMNYASLRAGPLGDVLVGRTHAVYEAPEAFSDVMEKEALAVSSFSFADPGMQKEMSRFLPAFESAVSRPGTCGAAIRKAKGAVLLADLAERAGGRIAPVHVAWIVSGLLNVACYAAWSGVSHGAVSPETVFVDPSDHSVMLLGGWGFATRFGERPAALPESTVALLPRLAVAGQAAQPSDDLHLVRAAACEILAAPGGGGLAMQPDVPAPMREWLLLPPAADAVRDYGAWRQCLEASFGKRKFVEFGLTARDVYGD